MNRPHRAFSANGNKIAVYIFYVAYLINDWLIRSKRIERQLWNFLKVELFYIGGHCQHSGNCCKNIMLFHEDIPITHVSLFETVRKKYPTTYRRFIPLLSPSSEGKIGSFNCKDLDKNKRCRDYENRPIFCRRYPLSSFLKNDLLMEDCGYKVLRTNCAIPGRNARFLKRINTLLPHEKRI